MSSFLTRYREWHSGSRQRRDALPPRFNPKAGCYPALYKGQCIKFHDDFGVAEINIWNGFDWVWTNIQITGLRDRHLLSHSKGLSPSLIVKNGRAKAKLTQKLHKGFCKGLYRRAAGLNRNMAQHS
ncbi:hypothetical protein NIES593_09415 [Hydrococcus rivularis NIES-593]|uniref:Transposase n=1 Tax=Hydrococcus rivularis NIES-593 TaxID=1921803 RepID=A0A1U7HJZ7_9CYAN|nr:hypothetical protein [Hydrococcus rivularis]OKH23858.1 hypothetical protein NIES593_09415 [Hydrococcus rivularis NIES-593]